MVVGGRGEVDGGREGMGIRGRREEGGVAENIAKKNIYCVSAFKSIQFIDVIQH